MSIFLPKNKAAYLILMTVFLLPNVTNAQFDTLTPFSGTSTGTLLDSVRNIVNALLSLAALVAGIVLVFSFVTALSGRDGEEVAKRVRMTIVFTIIGLIVIALSAVIINFIILAIP
jgi:hypothetical protein